MSSPVKTKRQVANPQNKQPDGQIVVSQQWSGPLPPPKALADFDLIIPGASERILGMVEAEQKHRISYESTALQAQMNDNKRRNWLGAGIAFLAISACVFTVYIGAHWAVSVALVGLPIAAIVGSIAKK
jgi:uncharacterized membrane protein